MRPGYAWTPCPAAREAYDGLVATPMHPHTLSDRYSARSSQRVESGHFRFEYRHSAHCLRLHTYASSDCPRDRVAGKFRPVAGQKLFPLQVCSGPLWASFVRCCCNWPINVLGQCSRFILAASLVDCYLLEVAVTGSSLSEGKVAVG